MNPNSLANLQTHNGPRLSSNYKAGWNACKSFILRELKEHYRKISLLVFATVTPSEKKYLLLKSLMEFGITAVVNQRRKKKKVDQICFPSLLSLHQVKQIYASNPLDFETGRPFYQFGDAESWTFGDGTQEKNCASYRGHMVELLNVTKRLDWLRLDDKLSSEHPQHLTIKALVWSDGARVERAVVYGRIRFFDTSESRAIIPDIASKMMYWYCFVGKETDIAKISELRNRQLQMLEECLFSYNGVTFKVTFKFVSGDNSLEWKEFGITSPFRCCICLIPADTIDWMMFHPNSNQRTLEFQKNNVGNYGIKRVPWFAESNRDGSDTVAAVATMHDLKHCLHHGLELIQHFCIVSKGEAKKTILSRMAGIIGTIILWNRHVRKTFANWDTIMNGLLVDPVLNKLGALGAGLSFLCNTKNIGDATVFYCALQTYSFLFVQIVTYYYQKVKNIDSVPNCGSTYDHAILNHLGDQFWDTRIPPIFLAEDEGEASIKEKKKVNTNHKTEDSIVRGLLQEQYYEVADRYLPISRTTEYRASKSVSPLENPEIQNVKIHSCMFCLNDDHSMINFRRILNQRVPDLIFYDEIQEELNIGLDSNSTMNLCKCGKY